MEKRSFIALKVNVVGTKFQDLHMCLIVLEFATHLLRKLPTGSFPSRSQWTFFVSVWGNPLNKFQITFSANLFLWAENGDKVTFRSFTQFFPVFMKKIDLRKFDGKTSFMENNDSVFIRTWKIDEKKSVRKAYSSVRECLEQSWKALAVIS